MDDVDDVMDADLDLPDDGETCPLCGDRVSRSNPCRYVQRFRETGQNTRPSWPRTVELRDDTTPIDVCDIDPTR